MQRHAALWATSIGAALVTLTMASGAEAQYFGRNKVQYKELAFEVLATEHFDIYFYPEERDGAADVARMAERWYARLSTILRHALSRRQPIVLYASQPDFQQTNVVTGAIGEGTGGVTEGLKQRIVLPLTGALAETDHVLGHELVHAFQYNLARRPDVPGEGSVGSSSLDRLPLWFVEGMAEYLSIGPVDPHTAMWLRDAARDKKLPEIGKLDDSRYFPYRWGQALWAYAAGRSGDRFVRDIFDAALQVGPESALERVIGLKTKELSSAWHEAIYAQYNNVLETTRRASTYGRPLTRPQGDQRPLTASPSLSPDGRRVAFFSEQDWLSVDLFLADADTGRVIRKLVDTATDTHFTSLQFIGSSGSWRPTGGQLVVAAVRDGVPVLAILDVETGRRVRNIDFPALGEILNPAWSPDGGSIAFSATNGGYSDLYLYDLERGVLRRLTSDRFADLQPAWSPDGDRLAFVTDGFSTNLETLDSGAYRLALLNPATGVVEALQTFDGSKSISPQWAPDGRTLYFLSDRDGVTNIYGLDPADGSIRQVTDLDTGVSGITALSPALSAASDSRRLAFSVYDDSHVGIYIMTEPGDFARDPVRAARTGPPAAALPPETRTSGEVLALLQDAATGLPTTVGASTPYRPRLSLDWVGQPYVGVGISRFGPTFGGGLSMLFSDMLGNHNLMATVDLSTSGTGLSDLYKDVGGGVAYQNLTHLWDWGVFVEQQPYIAGGFLTGTGISGGQPVVVEQTIVQRQILRGVGTAVARPLSPTRRVEFGGGYQRLSFEQSTRTTTASLFTGRIISDERETSALAGALNLGHASAAAVFDSSVFGATSPVAGQRSRFEVTPTVGTIAFTGALADYRRYLMPARFYTIAGRVMHYGRYGSGAEDGRLLPLFIGYSELVRGYDIGSFDSTECTRTSSGSCVEFDRLLGSRMLVTNLEFRFPLLRPFGVSGGRMYGPIPVEVGLFADGGVAWTATDRPTFFGGGRKPVSSAGVTFRINLFNFAIAQVDMAHPFQRPGRTLVWGFSLTPGF
jgi:Tol biopolymer transport system component